jgi:hypothetical protein
MIGQSGGMGPGTKIMPSGDGPGMMPIPPTRAKAEPPPKRTASATIKTIKKRVIAGFSSSCFEFVARRHCIANAI